MNRELNDLRIQVSVVKSVRILNIDLENQMTVNSYLYFICSKNYIKS